MFYFCYDVELRPEYNKNFLSQVSETIRITITFFEPFMNDHLAIYAIQNYEKMSWFTNKT